MIGEYQKQMEQNAENKTGDHVANTFSAFVRVDSMVRNVHSAQVLIAYPTCRYSLEFRINGRRVIRKWKDNPTYNEACEIARKFCGIK